MPSGRKIFFPLTNFSSTPLYTDRQSSQPTNQPSSQQRTDRRSYGSSTYIQKKIGLGNIVPSNIYSVSKTSIYCLLLFIEMLYFLYGILFKINKILIWDQKSAMKIKSYCTMHIWIYSGIRIICIRKGKYISKKDLRI